MSKIEKVKSFFINGPISPQFIAKEIDKHSTKTSIGGHSIFLGQVRADIKNGRVVSKIEYSCYEEMANKIIFKIREDAFSKMDLSCLHIFHSKGIVPAGKISLFIFVSSAHRKESIKTMTEIVEKVKSDVPVWKKEIMEDMSEQWV